ncbi:hypothetical protein HJB79_31520 [Rhizobium lentis]|uniref:phage tail tip lysozyme n=1 Tax=Rhizobium lentis TaxID=1138194 RepID=UPI001C829560|nr:phage tail tip lysozyme [Rhizobium lentis]MBX5143240.1 hypothetical protein [Rhizobium lentis]
MRSTAPIQTGKEWDTIAPRLVGDLSKDFQLTPEQAAGVVGQLGQESFGFSSLQEKNPLVPGSRGGYGYAQWTGPRRKQFEAFTQASGLDPSSYEANYGFLKNELMNTPEGKVLEGLRAAPDALSAGRLFTDQFLRPGIPHYDSRDAWTKRALAFANGGPIPQAAPNEVASLDPSAGMPMPGATGQMRASDPSRPMTQAAAPALPPPTTVTPAPPVASAAPAPAPNSQVAQALTAPPAPSGGYSRETISRLLSNPYTEEAGQQLLMQEMRRRNEMQQAQYEQQLKQSDPKYRQDLEKGSIELQNLREPKMSPSEQATDAREREKMAFEREKFDAEVKKGQWQKLTDGRLYNQTTGEFKDAPPPVPGSVAPKFDDIAGLRKEVYQLPSYKNMSQALPIYRSMAETAGRNTKASDLNLVYGLGKIMDPNSVVREGEMVMVKNTASLPDWLQGAIASLNGGAALTPETRQAIMTEAYGRMQGYDQAFKQDMSQYQGIVQRNNLNQADIIPDLGAFEPWKPDPNAAVSAPATNQGPIGTDWQELSPGVRIRKVQ